MGIYHHRVERAYLIFIFNCPSNSINMFYMNDTVMVNKETLNSILPQRPSPNHNPNHHPSPPNMSIHSTLHYTYELHWLHTQALGDLPMVYFQQITTCSTLLCQVLAHHGNLSVCNWNKNPICDPTLSHSSFHDFLKWPFNIFYNKESSSPVKRND